jgi:hypothetical protein
MKYENHKSLMLFDEIKNYNNRDNHYLHNQLDATLFKKLYSFFKTYLKTL